MTQPVAALRRALAARHRRRADAAAARRNRSRATHCFYCSARFEGTGKLARTIDHRVPRGRGGSDGLANLVFACRACNQRKGDLFEEEFLALAWLQQRRQGNGSRPPSDP